MKVVAPQSVGVWFSARSRNWEGKGEMRILSIPDHPREYCLEAYLLMLMKVMVRESARAYFGSVCAFNYSIRSPSRIAYYYIYTIRSHESITVQSGRQYTWIWWHLKLSGWFWSVSGPHNHQYDISPVQFYIRSFCVTGHLFTESLRCLAISIHRKGDTGIWRLYCGNSENQW